MKMKTLIISASLTCVTTSFAAPIIYNFQSLPDGYFQGGFVSLTADGVNAFFSGNGTTVSVNPSTGTHVLHTGNYQSQMGIEFSMPVSQIIVGIDGSIPTASNSVQTFEYYGPGDNLYGMSTISSSGSTLVFNVPNNFPEVFGILLDGNSGNGYSLDYVSIELVPEPAATTLLVLGATTAILLRVTRRTIGKRTADVGF
jgi:hypothetical protein